MIDIWLISDTHFNHANILNFASTWKQGERVRPEFEPGEIDKMNQAICDNWNSIISPGDKVYHLGDLGSDKGWLAARLPGLHGRKRLILGNHDNYEVTFYAKFFERVMVSRKIDGVLLSHYPVVLEPHEINTKANIHGHTHEFVLKDQKYLNVSVEQIGYKPIHIDEAFSILRKRGIDV